MGTEKTDNRNLSSPPALNAAAASLLCVFLGVYIVYRHWNVINIYAVFLIFIPLGIQLVGQFQRARRIVRSKDPIPAASRSLIFDLLFWAAIGNLTFLIYIAVLLKHMDGFY